MMFQADDPLRTGVEEAQSCDGSGDDPGATAGHIYGLESIGRPDVIWWAGDARDAAALRESGYPQTVWLMPRGSDPFAGLREHPGALAGFERVIICAGDRGFSEELARRLGRHRCWRAAWPEACADAAATLQRLGRAAVHSAVEGAEPWPIAGIHHPTAAALLDFHASPAPVTLTTGCLATDQVLRLPSEGKLCVVTGIPSHGKSTWLLHVAAHTAAKHGRRWAIFSPEMGSWVSPAAHLLAWRTNKPFRGAAGIEGVTADEVAAGAEWLGHHFVFLACDATDDTPTMDWLLDHVRTCILRHGTTDCLIDPWNELEHARGGLTEAEYANRSLQRLRAFTARHGVNVWIVAHPTKLRPEKPGAPLAVPSSYDVAGGAAWANKADLLLAIHRPNLVNEVHVLKSRFRRWGTRGTKAEIELDVLTGRFRSAQAVPALGDGY